ncbi:polyketide synthase dehydratase domain-containing protein, partial [Actinoplanes sp. DH11]|uniref:polyketide synthase dehydratase domain-containing protein n=1 Tax=Actinoplanes sp. DH11 TaxID=2857011 RepID=UPI001E4FDBC2
MTVEADVDGFGIHPALLDAALHPAGVLVAAGTEPLLPFVFSGVRLLATQARTVRVRMTGGGGGVSLLLAD